MSYISKYVNKIINLVYPFRCPYCNELIDFDKAYCPKCEFMFPIISRVRTIGITYDKEIYCISIFDYHSEVKDAIWRFKFRGDRSLSKPFAMKMADCIKGSTIFNIEYDIITSVPLSALRYINRGYNQSGLLGTELSNILKTPYKRLLKKKKNNRIQHNLSQKERIENVKGVYSVIDSSKIINKTILLCDDIVTTGSTLKECANVLYAAGAKRVLCIAIAESSKSLELIEHIC